MDPLPAPFLALIAATIARLLMGHEERARSSPSGPAVPPQQWQGGWVRSQAQGELTRTDWILAIGSFAAVVGIIVIGIGQAIAG